MNDIPKEELVIQNDLSVFNTLKADVKPVHKLGAGSYWEKSIKL